MAEQIVLNAKCQRPSACNALETLLVDAAVAEKFLPKMAAALAAKQTEVRACAKSQSLMPGAKAATEQDFRTEHLGLILNVKIVTGLAEAVAPHRRLWLAPLRRHHHGRRVRRPLVPRPDR
ncbi:gamma-glutamyl phosphate reductase [Opitutia bacterium]|nr:gamma-glutamyl phosphate reductase [Opitutae bacterium]